MKLSPGAHCECLNARLSTLWWYRRVDNLAHMYNLKTNRFGLSRAPSGLKWGSLLSGTDDTLCHDDRPVVFMLVGEVKYAAFYDGCNNPEKYVRLLVRPTYHDDLVVAHDMLRTCCHNIISVPSPPPDVVEVGRKQTRRCRNTCGTEAYPFKHAFDASASYGPKSTMPLLSPADIGYCDLVLVECRLVRFRVDKDTGRATYYVYDWVSWRCRFDIVSICQLRVGDEALTDDEVFDEDVPVV
ncbi:hypothetical protein C8Q78DRAFT_975069 [Trametes maxima]|nr:hypothetical protein C8Q78DRAFT_975069 [Trametes maxima]